MLRPDLYTLVSRLRADVRALRLEKVEARSPFGPWIDFPLDDPWTNVDEACPMQYCHATINGRVGLLLTGQVHGGASTDPLGTLPSEDRPPCDKDFDVLQLDSDGEPFAMAGIHIDAATGVVTPVFPIPDVDGLATDADLLAHISDPTAAHAASAISASSATLSGTATDVQGVLEELDNLLDAHHTRHESGGADAIKLDDLATPDDNTDLNASTSRHGLLRKLSGTATEYLDGTGAFSTPAGGGGGGGGSVGVTEEKAYVEITTAVTVTSTSEASPTSVIAMTTDLTVNGSTPVFVEFFARTVQMITTTGAYVLFNLQASTNGGSSWTDLGRIGAVQTPNGTSNLAVPVHLRRRVTPAAGTVRYRIVAWGSASGNVVECGAGGASTSVPAFLRVVLASAASQAFVGARASNSSSQSHVGGGANGIFNADTEEFDTDGFHSTATNNSRMTIPAGKAGKYLVIVQGAWDSNTAGVRTVGIAKNGTALAYGAVRGSPDGGFTNQIAVAILDLAVGDYVEGYFYQDSSGGTRTVTLSNFEIALLAPAVVSGSGETLLYDSGPLGSAAASFDVSGISGSYTHLKVVMIVRSDKAGVADENMTMIFNNDTGANYDLQYHQDYGASTNITTESVGGTSFPFFSCCPAATAPSGAASTCIVEIPFYAQTTFRKTFTSRTSIGNTDTGGGNAQRIWTSTGEWRSAAALNRIKIALAGGNNFVAGSRLMIYGVA